MIERLWTSVRDVIGAVGAVAILLVAYTHSALVIVTMRIASLLSE